MPESHPANFPKSADLRISRRFSCALDLAIEWGAATLASSVKDISANGMFVEIDSPLWVGARFTAQLGLGQPLFVHCDVRRVVPRRGMGITYQAAEESGRVAISALLERLAGR